MQKYQVYDIGVVNGVGKWLLLQEDAALRIRCQTALPSHDNLHVGSEDIFLSLKVWLAQNNYSLLMRWHCLVL